MDGPGLWSCGQVVVPAPAEDVHEVVRSAASGGPGGDDVGRLIQPGLWYGQDFRGSDYWKRQRSDPLSLFGALAGPALPAGQSCSNGLSSGCASCSGFKIEFLVVLQ